jgi:hypothetical protein
MKKKRISERIKTILKNKTQIAEGIWNYANPKESIEAVASYRNNICLSCESIDLKGDSCIAPGSQPCCSLCGCSLKFKVRSMSSACPADKWKAVLTEEEEDKLYED